MADLYGRVTCIKCHAHLLLTAATSELVFVPGALCSIAIGRGILHNTAF